MINNCHTPAAALEIRDAAARLGITEDRVRQCRRHGLLQPVMIGRRHAVTNASVEALAREMRRPDPARRAPRRSHLRLVVNNC